MKSLAVVVILSSCAAVPDQRALVKERKAKAAAPVAVEYRSPQASPTPVKAAQGGKVDRIMAEMRRSNAEAERQLAERRREEQPLPVVAETRQLEQAPARVAMWHQDGSSQTDAQKINNRLEDIEMELQRQRIDELNQNQRDLLSQ